MIDHHRGDLDPRTRLLLIRLLRSDPRLLVWLDLTVLQLPTIDGELHQVDRPRRVSTGGEVKNRQDRTPVRTRTQWLWLIVSLNQPQFLLWMNELDYWKRSEKPKRNSTRSRRKKRDWKRLSWAKGRMERESRGGRKRGEKRMIWPKRGGGDYQILHREALGSGLALEGVTLTEKGTGRR